MRLVERHIDRRDRRVLEALRSKKVSEEEIKLFYAGRGV